MKVSYRQLSLIVFFMLIAFKLLGLPSLMYQTCKNNGYISVLIGMLVDVLMVGLCLKILKQSGDKNIYQFLKNRVGSILAKILLICLIIGPTINILIKSKGLEWFLIENLYDEFRWYQYTLPLVGLMSYIAYKGCRNIGRVCEMLVWVVILGVVIIIVKSIGSVDITFFMPFLKDGVQPVFKALYQYAAWFGLSCELLLFAGNIDFTQEKKWTMWKYILIALIVVQLVLWCFYGIFSITAGTYNFAISDISQISNANMSLDGLSWLIVSVWAVGQMIQLAIYSYLFTRALKLIFNIQNDWVPILIFAVLLTGWMFGGQYSVMLEKLFVTPYFVWATIISQYIVPVIIFMISFIREKVKGDNISVKDVEDEKMKSEISKSDSQSKQKINASRGKYAKT